MAQGTYKLSVNDPLKWPEVPQNGNLKRKTTPKKGILIFERSYLLNRWSDRRFKTVRTH